MADPPIFAPGETLPADKLQPLGSAPALWTPTLGASTTPPTLGTGSSRLGVWTQNGSVIDIWFQITFGTSGVNPGNGFYTVSVPVPILLSPITTPIVGTGWIVDASPGPAGNIIGLQVTSASALIMPVEAGTLVTQAAPWTWAASDSISGHARYIGDF